MGEVSFRRARNAPADTAQRRRNQDQAKGIAAKRRNEANKQ